MTIFAAQQDLVSQLIRHYDDREAANICDWAMEHITGMKKIDRLLHKQALLTPKQETAYASLSRQLAQGRPVQYVLGECWFAGMKFYVDEAVLIPRPETEELVEWVLETQKAKQKEQTAVLDIGTGSGCIPISLKKKQPNFSITGIDISQGALEVAKKNAQTLQSSITLLPFDFLDESSWNTLPLYDIIISNPPYIRWSEAAGMAKHVVEHEPKQALFVPDEDPLVFYRKIALFAKKHLNRNGMIFLEINELLGNEVVGLFENNGYKTESRQDLQGRDRMIRAAL